MQICLIALDAAASDLLSQHQTHHTSLDNVMEGKETRALFQQSKDCGAAEAAPMMMTC